MKYNIIYYFTNSKDRYGRKVSPQDQLTIVYQIVIDGRITLSIRK